MGTLEIFGKIFGGFAKPVGWMFKTGMHGAEGHSSYRQAAARGQESLVRHGAGSSAWRGRKPARRRRIRCLSPKLGGNDWGMTA